MGNKIWLSSPHMGEMEQVYVKQAFRDNWVAPVGPSIIKFEEQLSKITDIPHTVALSSGTSAIHLALILLGVGYGDEVICQSLTFAASANPIKYLGATPVFVDSEADTWNMDPDALRDALEDRLSKGKKVKAIIPVHLYGMPAKMDAIMEIANEYGIPVVEDAAEALGSKIGDRKVGTYGEMSVLSFNGNKIITTSGGGALLSPHIEYINKARFLSTQARDNAVHYEHSEVGYNYRMSNISASIGRGQLEVLPERVNRRRYNFDFYKKHLGSFAGISFQQGVEGMYSNRWLSVIQIDSEVAGVSYKDLMAVLLKDNIESRPVWKPMHLQPVFKDCPYYGNQVAEELFNNGLCLPSGSNMTDDDLIRVSSLLIEAIVNQTPSDVKVHQDV